jgi:hypothetical protein
MDIFTKIPKKNIKVDSETLLGLEDDILQEVKNIVTRLGEAQTQRAALAILLVEALSESK